MYASFLDCSWCVKSKVSSSVAEPNKEKPRLLRKVMCFFGIFFLFGKDLGTCVFTHVDIEVIWGHIDISCGECAQIALFESYFVCQHELRNSCSNMVWRFNHIDDITLLWVDCFTCRWPYCGLTLNIPLVFIQHLSCQLPAQGAVESKQKEGHLGLELFERALLMFVTGLPIKENLVTPWEDCILNVCHFEGQSSL